MRSSISNSKFEIINQNLCIIFINVDSFYWWTSKNVTWFCIKLLSFDFWILSLLLKLNFTINSIQILITEILNFIQFPTLVLSISCLIGLQYFFFSCKVGIFLLFSKILLLLIQCSFVYSVRRLLSTMPFAYLNTFLPAL